MATTIPPKSYTRDAQFPSAISLQPIGIVHSAHRERHGTPRQAVLPANPELRPEERTIIELFSSVLSPHATEDLADFEWLWVISWLHLNHGWRNKVNIPGSGRRTRGLLSTRAPHRPNPIGLSAVRLIKVDGLSLHLERSDLLDGTPVLDIKPYVPYADAFPNAKAGWIDERGPVPQD